MGYVHGSTPRTPQRRAGIAPSNPFRQSPPRFVAASPNRARIPNRIAKLRVENGGTNLGVLPLVAAAIPSVTDLAKKAVNSVVGIVDPGKRRDADREARANMYRDLALQGSLTAANRVYSASIGIHGGEGPTKEANWYKAAWTQIQTQLPALAAQVITLPRVGLPDPQRPELSPTDQQVIQNEINAFHGVASPANAQSVSQAGIGGNAGMLLALGLVGAYLVKRR